MGSDIDERFYIRISPSLFQECPLRAACLLGRGAVSRLSWGATAALALSAAGARADDAVVPPQARRVLRALRDSLLYSEDCSRYPCRAE